MAQQTIGLGAAPNDGTGDDLRTAGGKINDNFTELYAANGAMPETVQDLVASMLIAGANVSLTYDDGAGTLTIDATATSSGIADFNEAVDDRVTALIVAGSGVTKTYNDVAGTLTLSVSVAGSYLAAANNLSDLADAATARSNLGVYSTAQVDAAVAAAGGGYTPGGTDVAIADGGTGASSASAARTNLSVYSKAETDAAIIAGSSGKSGLFILSTPTLSTFPTTQKTSTLTDSSAISSAGYFLLNPTQTTAISGESGIARFQSLPSTTFDKTMGMVLPVSHNTYWTNGLMISNASGGAALIVGISYRGGVTPYMTWHKMSATGTGTTWTQSSDGAITNVPMHQNLVWVRLTGDGTTLTGYVSFDKVNWVRVIQETFATFVTAPTLIGPGIFMRLTAGTGLPTGLADNYKLTVVDYY